MRALAIAELTFLVTVSCSAYSQTVPAGRAQLIISVDLGELPQGHYSGTCTTTRAELRRRLKRKGHPALPLSKRLIRSGFTRYLRRNGIRWEASASRTSGRCH